VFIDLFYRRRIKVQPLYKGITNKFQQPFKAEDTNSHGKRSRPVCAMLLEGEVSHEKTIACTLLSNRGLPLPAIRPNLQTKHPEASYAQRAPAADPLQYDDTKISSSAKEMLVVVCEPWRQYEP